MLFITIIKIVLFMKEMYFFFFLAKWQGRDEDEEEG